MKKAVSLVLVIAMLFSFCACQKVKSLFSSSSGQTFSYPIREMPKTLDPQIASNEAELIVIENCMEGLVRFNAAGQIVPAVAARWDISADGLKYTFHLNPHAAWAVDDEGLKIENFRKQITADDFVFALSRAVLKETGAPDFQSVSMIKNALEINASGTDDASSLGVKAVDDNTLVIVLESANSDFLSSLTSAVFMPCSRQFFEYCAGRYGRQSKYFLSNAGLTLRAWNETNLVMKKSEQYALQNISSAESVTLYRDENAFESFKNDNYDALAINDDYIDEALADKTLTVQSYDDTVWVLGLNCESRLCADKTLRQALMLAVETDTLTAHEWAIRANGLVPNICTAGGDNYRESAGRAKMVQYVPDEAREKFGDFSRRYLEEEDADDLPSFNFLCTAAFEQTAKQIVQSWQKNFGTGFEVKITVLSLSELTYALEHGDYDGVIAPISADTTDALVFLKKFASENVFGYLSESYNDKINSDLNETEKCTACENRLMKDGVLYPLYTSNSYYVQRNTVSGIYFYAFGGKVNFLNAERVK